MKRKMRGQVALGVVSSASLVGILAPHASSADCSLPDLRGSYQRHSESPGANSGSAYDVSDFLVHAMEGDCPELDWKDIKNIGMEIAKHDWAVLSGTKESYNRRTFKHCIQGAAEAALECHQKGTPSNSLYDCIRTIACREVGAYSEDCGHFPRP